MRYLIELRNPVGQLTDAHVVDAPNGQAAQVRALLDLTVNPPGSTADVYTSDGTGGHLYYDTVKGVRS